MDQVQKTLLSRFYLEAVTSLKTAKKSSDMAEKHFHERHTKDGRNSLMQASSALKQGISALEEIRKVLGLEDPTVIRKNELAAQFKKVSQDLLSAQKRKEKLQADGENDPNILAAMEQVISRYQDQRTDLASEMQAEGLTAFEIQAMI